MNRLVYALFLVIFSVEFAAASFSFVPRIAAWTPELMSGVILLAVLGQLGATRPAIPARYLVWALYMLLVIVAGIVLNQVQPGAVFAGIRKYFRYAPVFMLPLVYVFSEADLRRQLRVLLALVLLQLPVSIYQRVVVYAEYPTGDVVQGTVMGSGTLSVLLLCTIAMLTAFYARGRIRLGPFLLLSAACFVPTTINETTATLVLLPVAIGAPFVFALGAGTRLARLIPVGVLGAMLLVAFVTSYSAQFDRWGGDVTRVLTGEGLEFLYRGADADSRGGGDRGMAQIGRWDSMVMPFLHTDDYSKLVVGVGIGNASATFNPVLAGAYSEQVDSLGIDFTTVSMLIWEVGLLGLALSLLLFYMVFRDALALRHLPGLPGTFCTGMAAVCVILGVTAFYTGMISHNVVGYLMWLSFGHVAALRQRCQPSSAPAPPLPPHPILQPPSDLRLRRNLH